MLIGSTDKYFRAPFKDESEIEEVVRQHSEHLFGSSSIFLPKAKISTLGGTGTIPDGFVIDVESEEWFVVEAELASHGTWQHIAPQVSKQLAAIDSPSTRKLILNICLDLVKTEDSVASVFSDLGIADIEIHGKLQEILYKPPTIAIPIDSIPQDLRSWVKTLKFTSRIWVIEKYTSLDQSQVLYSLPDENIPTISTSTAEGKIAITVTARWSQPYQDVLQAGILHEGQQVFLDYGPRGKPKHRFEGILRKEGVEVDEKVMSLSTAAVYCIQKAGSDRETANGWIMWKTEDGTYLNDFYNQVYAENQEPELQEEDAQ